MRTGPAGSALVRSSSQLVLRLPDEDEEDEVFRAYRATCPDVPTFLHRYQEGMSLREYLRVLYEQRHGINIAPGSVPSTLLFAFVGDRVVGRVSIRHSLNENLERLGGHIGYAVVPEFRRRGYATTMLRLALDIAHGELGIRRVLVTCDNDNIASRRVIEKCGGVLDNILNGPDLAVPKRRYWFEAHMGTEV